MEESIRSRFAPALAALCIVSAPAARSQAAACTAPEPVQEASRGGPHIVHTCAPIAYPAYPPTSGEHFGSYWAKPGTYDLFMSPGYWLHSAEHGAVIFLYHCPLPGRCPEDVAALQAIADAYPVDASCDAASRHRIIIAPDSVMTTRFAAIAWTWSLKSDCLDTAAFRDFLAAHYNHAPEDICGGGTNLSGTGWCTEPVGLRRAPERTAGTPGGYVLWQGTLEGAGRLELEMTSLDGAVSASHDLGPAGPGPARAVWEPSKFRRNRSGGGAMACRVRFKGTSRVRILAETLVFP